MRYRISGESNESALMILRDLKEHTGVVGDITTHSDGTISMPSGLHDHARHYLNMVPVRGAVARAEVEVEN